MENSNVKMLREISNDRITPKKSDKMESSKDFYERLVDQDDLFCNEVERVMRSLQNIGKNS